MPLASIVFSIPLFFGWAKPVPVDSRNLKNARTDMFWIALAGPASNVLLAIVSTAILFFIVRTPILIDYHQTISTMLQMFILTNLFLAVFNIIPLHPLDGGKVLARFLPTSLNHKLEQNEQMTSIILMVLLISGALSILRIPVMFIYGHLMSIVGVGSIL